MQHPGSDTALADLSAQHVTGTSVDEEDADTGERRFYFRLGDDERAVNITHDIGDPADAALRLDQLALALRAHAERLRYRVRSRTTGWS